MKQLTLDLGWACVPTLSSFFAGSNAAPLQYLQQELHAPTATPAPVYLWGDSGSGKTHLLTSVRHDLLGRGLQVGWLDPSTDAPDEFDDAWHAVCLDDVHRYTPQQQHMAFNWFVNAMTPKAGQLRWVLAAGALPPADLPLREDLRTRLGWGHVFALQMLSEAERRAVLHQQAQARGLVLRTEVVDFMMSHFSRDLASLTALLDHLDSYALQTQRAITIPLIKSMLENE
jgi:DnaA family protein